MSSEATTSSSIEADLADLLDIATVFTHLEPLEDPASFEDTRLDRVITGEDPADPDVKRSG